MADASTCPPLTPASIIKAHERIQSYIHRTPLLTSKTLDQIASSPDPAAYFSEEPPVTENTNGVPCASSASRPPQFRLHFKAENYQRIGAFKARGAYHAILHLMDSLGLETLQQRGVITHSSGNHAQALALAASTFRVPAYIVMPSISTPSKIQGTRQYTKHVIFSGSTSDEREAKVAQVQKETGAILVPPYDHPDIILGQGTTGKEMSEQFQEWRRTEFGAGRENRHRTVVQGKDLDAVIAPIGGGGLLGGIATWFSDKSTFVFGAEPSFEGADDARRGLALGKRIEKVKTLTIADGLRTPVGVTNWGIVSDPEKVKAIFSVSEEDIKMAMRLVFERVKCVVEPSGCVSLAVVLFNQEFREMASKKQEEELQMREASGEAEKDEAGNDVPVTWDVGVVFSGGNTTMKAIAGLFGEEPTQKAEREEAKVDEKGERIAENVAG